VQEKKIELLDTITGVGFGTVYAKKEYRQQLPCGGAMNGSITTRHLLTHAHVIVSEFGLKIYLRCWTNCVFRSKSATFLDNIF